MDGTRNAPTYRSMFQVPHHVLTVLTDSRDSDVLQELRSLVARDAIAGEVWEQTWNRVTRARPNRPARVRVSAMVRCDHCHGRRFSLPTGGSCHQCLGRGQKRSMIDVTCRAVTEPDNGGVDELR